MEENGKNLEKELEEKIRNIRFEKFLEIIYTSLQDEDAFVKIFYPLLKGNPNLNHYFLACGLGEFFDYILTTNQDLLIEKACINTGKQPKYITKSGNKIFEEGKIIKLHGCVQKPWSIIALLRQLIKGLSTYRAIVLQDILERYEVVFTGYSGKDEDIFRIIYNSNPRKIYWNIAPNGMPSENVIRIYHKYKPRVTLFKIDLNSFFSILFLELFGDYKKYKDISKGSFPYNLLKEYQKWIDFVGDVKFNIIGRILSNDQVKKYKEAIQCFDQMEKITQDSSFNSIKKFELLGKVNLFKGDCYMDYKESTNNYERAFKFYNNAFSLYSKVNNKKKMATALIGMGESCRHRNQYGRAIECYTRAIKEIEKDTYEEALALHYLADVFRMQDRYVESIENYRRAYKIFIKNGYLSDAVYSLIWLGHVFMYRGDYGLASRYNTIARKLSQKYLFEQNLAWAKYVEVDICKYKGVQEIEALEGYEAEKRKLPEVVIQISKLFAKLNNRLGRAWSHEMLAELYRLERKYDKANNEIRNCIRLCREDYKTCLTFARLNEAELLRARQKYEIAMKKYIDVLNTDLQGVKRHYAHAFLGIAEIKRTLNEDARNEYEDALSIYRQIGMRYGIINSLIRMALAYSSPFFLEKAYIEASKRPKCKKELKIIKEIRASIGKNHRRYLALEFP